MSEITREDGTKERLVIAGLTNLAFASELFMKALLTHSNVEFRGDHDLWKLYKKLPEDVRTHICDGATTSTHDVERRVRKVRRIFESWRYHFEKQRTATDEIQFLRDFASRLEKVCRERLAIADEHGVAVPYRYDRMENFPGMINSGSAPGEMK
jgi:hypothetical protein